MRMLMFYNVSIHQVYCYSGGFVGTVLTDIVALVLAVVTESDPEDEGITRDFGVFYLRNPKAT